MTPLRALLILLGTTLLIAVIGGGVGYGLGVLSPGYYRSVFPNGSEPSFDPVSVGVGQGLTQGTAGGVVAGLFIVALLCRREGRFRAAGVHESGKLRGQSARRIMVLAVSLLVLAFCCWSSYLLGTLAGTFSAY